MVRVGGAPGSAAGAEVCCVETACTLRGFEDGDGGGDSRIPLPLLLAKGTLEDWRRRFPVRSSGAPPSRAVDSFRGVVTVALLVSPFITDVFLGL